MFYISDVYQESKETGGPVDIIICIYIYILNMAFAIITSHC